MIIILKIIGDNGSPSLTAHDLNTSNSQIGTALICQICETTFVTVHNLANH